MSRVSLHFLHYNTIFVYFCMLKLKTFVQMDADKLYKCRLCLANTARKVEIFRHDFPKMIELLTGIKVDPNDGLPQDSCLDCARDVKFCMSLRKQIIQSYKTLLNHVMEEQDEGQSKPVEDKVTVFSKRRKKREETPESTSEEEGYDGNYNSEASEEAEGSVIGENEIEEVNVQEYEVEEEIDEEEEMEVLVVEEVNVKEEDQEESVAQPLSPERLLKKRRMIAASNKILYEQNERRLARNNVIFVRKSTREKLNLQQQSMRDKGNTKIIDDENVIWKNGKKYASCEICKKEVKKHYLKHHMSTHFPEHFSCDICGVVTRNLRGLRYHKLYWHSSKLDYICDKCGKKYRSKHALDLHNKKEHGGVRDLECDICGKKFFQKMHLKRHVDGIHKKLRPHKCEYCGKDFTKRTHLVTHWRTHTNETPYGCDLCEERFKLKLSLRNHQKRAHNFEEKESVFCEVCNRGFATQQGLRAHINSRVHEGEKCPYCSESFTPEYLKIHLRDVHMVENDYFPEVDQM